MSLQPGPELVPVNQHAALVPILTQAARDHLDRHADLDRLAAQVGQLGGYQRASSSLTSATVYGALSSKPVGAS